MHTDHATTGTGKREELLEHCRRDALQTEGGVKWDAEYVRTMVDVRTTADTSSSSCAGASGHERDLSRLRVLQFNILADGMPCSSFITRVAVDLQATPRQLQVLHLTTRGGGRNPYTDSADIDHQLLQFLVLRLASCSCKALALHVHVLVLKVNPLRSRSPRATHDLF